MYYQGIGRKGDYHEEGKHEPAIFFALAPNIFDCFHSAEDRHSDSEDECEGAKGHCAPEMSGLTIDD